MKTLVIGYGNLDQQGKDTAAQAVIDAYGATYDITRYAFGDEVKSELYDLLLAPLHPFWGFYNGYFSLPHPREEFIPQPAKVAWVNAHKQDLRKVLRVFGTDYVRTTDPFRWLRIVDTKVMREQPRVALITDVRFLNEFLWVKSVGGFMVEVNRLGHDIEDVGTNHLSGVQYDYRIDVPDGELEELRKDSQYVFELIKERIAPVVPDSLEV